MANDPARWQRLESIVVAALARPAEERPAFLADVCGDDNELRREAASLLERESRLTGFWLRRSMRSPPQITAAGQPW